MFLTTPGRDPIRPAGAEHGSWISDQDDHLGVRKLLQYLLCLPDSHPDSLDQTYGIHGANCAQIFLTETLFIHWQETLTGVHQSWIMSCHQEGMSLVLQMFQISKIVFIKLTLEQRHQELGVGDHL